MLDAIKPLLESGLINEDVGVALDSISEIGEVVLNYEKSSHENMNTTRM